MTPDERKALWSKPEKTKADWAKLKTEKTPMFRVSFPHLLEPHKFKPEDKAKYSVVMLFPKNTDMSALKRAHDAALAQKFGEDPKKWPKVRSPFRDGDEKMETDGYAGNFFISASSEQKVGVIDRDRNPILDKDDVYAGCYGRAQIQAFYYDQKGNKGVSFALLNFQKLKDGDAFSGRKAAETVFDDDFEVDDDGLTVESNESGDDGMGF